MWSIKFKLMYVILIGSSILAWAQKVDFMKSADEFRIRTGLNASHWLSQSEKRGEERKNFMAKADFDKI